MLNVVLIGACLAMAAFLGYATDRATSIDRVALDRSLTEVDDAAPGRRVINVLLVGSDSSAELDPDDPIQIGRRGERFGDVIIIAHIDERSGDVALLSLPRDLWVPIAGTEREGRINNAFMTGGPATLIDTIEEAFDIPIHHYVNVDFAGFQGLVEAVDSVEIYFDAPARDWNVNAEPEPRSQTGFIVETSGCHSLDPEQALAYVRSRYYQTQDADGRWVTDPTSDLGRIQRQQDFLQRLLQKAIERGARNPMVLAELIDTGIANVAIDSELTPSMLLDLSGTFRTFDPGDLQTYTYPATDATIGPNRVLLPQDDLARSIRALFAGAPFDGTDTVGLTVVYDRSYVPAGTARLPDSVRDVLERLRDAGFTVTASPADDLEPGLVVRHSGDGAQAGSIAATALAGGGQLPLGPVRTHVGPDLVGRNVVVAIGPVAEPPDNAELALSAPPEHPGAVAPDAGIEGPSEGDPAQAVLGAAGHAECS